LSSSDKAKIDDLDDAATDLKTFGVIVIVLACIYAILHLGAIILISRPVCCTDSYAARKGCIMGMNFMIAEQVLTLLSWIIVWVIIFKIDFGDISGLLVGTVVNILLSVWWRHSCVQHSELLNPAKQ
jgi:hypothetical protein